MFVATTPGPDGSPKIMRDDNGKLVEDPRSAVFCPLKEGTTTLTMRVAGTAFSRAVTVREPLVSTEPTRPDSTTPELSGRCNAVAPQPAAEARPRRRRQHPSRRSPHARRPPPRAATGGTPARHAAGTRTDPSATAAARHHPDQPRPATRHRPPAARRASAPARRAGTHQQAAGAARATHWAQRSAGAGALAPGAASSPHVQVSSPQVQASSPQVQLQVQQTMQAAEQRRRQEALDIDEAAVADRHPDAPLPWEVLGAAALLTVAGGGRTAGRIRRRTATAHADQRT